MTFRTFDCVNGVTYGVRFALPAAPEDVSALLGPGANAKQAVNAAIDHLANLGYSHTRRYDLKSPFVRAEVAVLIPGDGNRPGVWVVADPQYLPVATRAAIDAIVDVVTRSALAAK